MIKTIIFDADGVLVFRKEYFSKRLGLSEDVMKKFFEGVFQECLVGKADLKEELPKYMHEWGWEGSVDELLKEWFEGERELNQELLSYIEKLRKKGITIYVGTNNEKYRTEYLRDVVGLGKVVHKFYGSGHIGHLKPDHKFFQYIIDDQKLDKDEVIFWDDFKENVKAARKFGIKAEYYYSFEDFEKKMKKYLAFQ